jgi:glycosyltransferase involved in cell wall biosynthesis
VTIPTYVVIPTRNRHEMLRNCIQSIVDDPSFYGVIIIDNLSNPALSPIDIPQVDDKPTPPGLLCPGMTIMRYHGEPPNISRMWNMGIDTARIYAQQSMHREFNIAVLNSDVVCPPGWLTGMGEGLRTYNADLAYPDQYGAISAPKKHVLAAPISLYERITGFAYMLRGESSIRLNEDLKWWYGDDDLDWRCREMNGSLLLPGMAVEHLDPNGSTNRNPLLAEQSGRDRETFQKIWGNTPW